MNDIFVIMHANRLWVNLYFTSYELAANYISFRINNVKKIDHKTFKQPISGATYKIEELENYSEAIKRN